MCTTVIEQASPLPPENVSTHIASMMLTNLTVDIFAGHAGGEN